MDTDVVLEQLKKGEKALQFPIFAAFGIGLYALMKVTNKKKFHRKGEEHGSARWANQKEIKSLLDRPPKKKIFLKGFLPKSRVGLRQGTSPKLRKIWIKIIRKLPIKIPKNPRKIFRINRKKVQK